LGIRIKGDFMKKLVIDLGHGGSDSGAVGQNKTNEADVVLAIGKELIELLKGCELEVKFTRLTNKYISLGERSKIANDFKADYFLSIHVNSAKDKSVRGIEVWQYSNGDAKLNTFSSGLCEDISNIFNVRNRGIKLSKELSVLKNTKMEACLVEVDFISNIAAERDLKVENNIKSVAIAIKNNLEQLFSIEADTTDTLYKVCIGAYRDKNNALNQVKLAKDKGFKDAYII
jgi:N-acetylmuramoyl-L-alanine amidase